MNYNSGNEYYNPYNSFDLYSVTYDLPIFDGYNFDVNFFINDISNRASLIPPYYEDELIDTLINNHLEGDAQDIAVQYDYKNYTELIALLSFHFDSSSLHKFQQYCNNAIKQLSRIYKNREESIEDFHYRLTKLIDQLRNELLHHPNFDELVYNEIHKILQEKVFDIFYQCLPFELRQQLSNQFYDFDDVMIRVTEAQNTIRIINQLPSVLKSHTYCNLLLNELIDEIANKKVNHRELENTPDPSVQVTKELPNQLSNSKALLHIQNTTISEEKLKLNASVLHLKRKLASTIFWFYKLSWKAYVKEFRECFSIYLIVLSLVLGRFKLDKKRQSCDLRIAILPN